MLVLLPPSESKSAPAARGKPVDLDGLSFPELTGCRQRVLEAVVATCARPDAVRRLGASPGLAAEVARNTWLTTLPSMRVSRLYTGVLYDALDAAGLESGARHRAARSLVVVSALWGALRPADRVPPYRLSMDADLPGIGPLASLWRPALEPVLAAAAGRGLVVDCRSTSYAAAWRPSGRLARRTVAIRVLREQDGRRSVVSHMAKHTRGLVARHLMQASTVPGSVRALAAELSTVWKVELSEPTRASQTWTADLILTD